MTQTVRDVMTANPVALSSDSTLAEAAAAMRDHDVGDVLVVDGDAVSGIVTDRDVTIRAVAQGLSPGRARLGEVSSAHVVIVSPTEPVDAAIELMRRHAVRRLPVVDHGRPVGIVSLGDLARERDPGSVLGKISAAQPNH